MARTVAAAQSFKCCSTVAFFLCVFILQTCGGEARYLGESSSSQLPHATVHRPRVRSLLENATDLGPQLNWAEQYGGSSREMAMAVAADGSGSVYSAGFLSSQNTAFGSSIKLSSRSPTGSDAFLAKVRARQFLSSPVSLQNRNEQALIRLLHKHANDSALSTHSEHPHNGFLASWRAVALCCCLPARLTAPLPTRVFLSALSPTGELRYRRRLLGRADRRRGRRHRIRRRRVPLRRRGVRCGVVPLAVPVRNWTAPEDLEGRV